MWQNTLAQFINIDGSNKEYCWRTKIKLVAQKIGNNQSKEVYLAAILFPVLIAPIIALLILNLKILKNNKIKSNKTHNALCIVNFILLPALVIAGFFSLTTFIYGGHGHSYTDKYSDYLTLMNEEPYKSNLPCFEEKEIQKFKYYENSIDSHQEDFFVVLEYDNEDQFINSLNRIKAFMPYYKTVINKFNDSYQDIINSNYNIYFFLSILEYM